MNCRILKVKPSLIKKKYGYNIKEEVDFCPNCKKVLEQIDYRDIYDSETDSCDVYIDCHGCGYNEYEEEGEGALEALFA